MGAALRSINEDAKLSIKGANTNRKEKIKISMKNYKLKADVTYDKKSDVLNITLQNTTPTLRLVTCKCGLIYVVDDEGSIKGIRIMNASHLLQALLKGHDRGLEELRTLLDNLAMANDTGVVVDVIRVERKFTVESRDEFIDRRSTWWCVNLNSLRLEFRDFREAEAESLCTRCKKNEPRCLALSLALCPASITETTTLEKVSKAIKLVSKLTKLLPRISSSIIRDIVTSIWQGSETIRRAEQRLKVRVSTGSLSPADFRTLHGILRNALCDEALRELLKPLIWLAIRGVPDVRELRDNRL